MSQLKMKFESPFQFWVSKQNSKGGFLEKMSFYICVFDYGMNIKSKLICSFSYQLFHDTPVSKT